MRGCVAEGIVIAAPVSRRDAHENGPKILDSTPASAIRDAVYLTRLENDLVELLDASVSGTLDKVELKWSPLASVCVVMASGGYPGNYAKGKPITGLDAANALPHTKVFHAGTALKDGKS